MSLFAEITPWVRDAMMLLIVGAAVFSALFFVVVEGIKQLRK